MWNICAGDVYFLIFLYMFESYLIMALLTAPLRNGCWKTVTIWQFCFHVVQNGCASTKTHASLPITDPWDDCVYSIYIYIQYHLLMYHKIQPFMQVNIPYLHGCYYSQPSKPCKSVKVSRFRKAKPIWKNRSFCFNASYTKSTTFHCTGCLITYNPHISL